MLYVKLKAMREINGTIGNLEMSLDRLQRRQCKLSNALGSLRELLKMPLPRCHYWKEWFRQMKRNHGHRNFCAANFGYHWFKTLGNLIRKYKSLTITWGNLVPGMNRMGVASFLTNRTGFIHFSVFNHICRVHLILLKDDKDGGILHGIHNGVTEQRRVQVHFSLGEISNQDSGHNHDGVFSIVLTIFMGSDGFFCKVIS